MSEEMDKGEISKKGSVTDDELGISPPQFTPSPLNLFMNIPIAAHDQHSLTFEKPTSKAGEYVCLRAEVDCVVAFSACPQVRRPLLQYTLGSINRNGVAP
jgi:uncharacterized protein YcgI (DUF1989 family)